MIPLLFFCGLLTLFSACTSKQPLISDLGVKNKKIPICLEMPKNNLAFENVSPILHQAFYNHFLRVGYLLVNTSSSGYSLRINVKSINPSNKFVSPDVVLMHTSIKIDLDCVLLDFSQQVVAQKMFSVSTLISKPRNPILNSDFIDFEYKRLFERSASRIERYFRPYLLDT